MSVETEQSLAISKLVAYFRRQGGQCNAQQPIVPVAGNELLKAADLLEASGIAELTEALEKAALDLHEQGARFLDGGNPVGCAELAHEAARRAEATLAKIGCSQ